MKYALFFNGGALVRTARRCAAVAVAGILAFNAPMLQAQQNEDTQNDSPPLAAGDAGEAGIEEIVVTATKRGDASVQDVAIAISALDTSRLRELGVSQFDQWAGQVSGLNFEDWGPGDKDFIIRGVNSPTGATVGVYFDEAVITGRFLENGGGRQLDFKLHDIERIEVLKGPQGTLYGANSMAGTIRIIPAKADLEKVDGRVEVEFHNTRQRQNYASYAVNGMLNIPLAKGAVGLRLVGWEHNDNGYIDNIRYNEPNVNGSGIRGGRVILDFQVADNFKIRAMAQLQDVELDNDSRITPPGVVSVGAPPLIGPDLPELIGGDNISTEYVRTPWDEQARIYGLTAEWDFSNGQVTATTNQMTRDIDYIYDSTPILIFFNAPAAAITNQIQKREVSTTEIRYASDFSSAFNFVVGTVYQEDTIDFDLHVLTADANGFPIGTFSVLDTDDAFTGGGNTIFGRTLTVESKNTAVFGEMNYELNEALTLILGMRYAEFESQSVSANTHPFFGFQGSAIDFQNRSTDDSKLTLKANLTYEPNNDWLIYTNVAQGFRPGGTNAVILPVAVTLPEGFDSDELTSYEVGAKASWLNNRVLLNTALYYTDWRDIQTGNSVMAFSFVDNLGEAAVWGAEFDVRYRPNEHLDISVGGSYIATELKSDEPTTVGDFPGKQGDELPNVPKLTGFSSVSYSWYPSGPLEKYQLKVRANLDYTYKGSSATEFDSANPYYNNLGAYGVLNFALGLSTERVGISFFIRNLLDEDKEIDVLEDDQEQRASIIVRPRTIGMRISYQM